MVLDPMERSIAHVHIEKAVQALQARSTEQHPHVLRKVACLRSLGVICCFTQRVEPLKDTILACLPAVAESPLISKGQKAKERKNQIDKVER